jgi:NAD(P)-dependent dehydrogenase (short-subunit alcohol dehydrogenase family)
MEFDGKTVVITGAGKGIGRAAAKLLAGRGAFVVALTRTKEDLDSLEEEIGCRSIVVDLADADATRRAAIAALPADLLVNNAGTTTLEPFVDVSVEAFDYQYAVNTRAPMIVAQEYARDRIRRGLPGSIVNVSSVASFIGFAEHAGYCASKGALDSLTRVMANELGRHGIRVNAINPTVTLTAMATKAWSDPVKSSGMLERIPLGRFAEPEDVAEAIAYLLSTRSGMLNGITLPLDGGFMVT